MVEICGKKCDYQGDVGLLERPKVAIVGSRRTTQYAKEMTFLLARGFAKRGWVVVSGAAMGIDAMAHRGAGAANTIAVLPCGIERRYPKVNASLIDEIAQKGLVISQFEKSFQATPWSFVVRNELVVGLGEFLIVTEAAKESGSMRSVAIAKELGKKIYVLPHRLGQSEGTNHLAANGEAEVIWDMQAFLERFGQEEKEDEVVAFLKSTPFLDEALERIGEKIFELELEGIVEIVGAKVFYKGE